MPVGVDQVFADECVRFRFVYGRGKTYWYHFAAIDTQLGMYVDMQVKRRCKCKCKCFPRLFFGFADMQFNSAVTGWSSARSDLFMQVIPDF